MRLVYSHFPINASVENAGAKLDIRNFLGDKVRNSSVNPMRRFISLASAQAARVQL
eukprot:SAG11_NODE_3649_length_2313_cov_2.827010_1_plen_56_part_00